MAVSQALLGAARVSRLVPRKRARANMRLPFCMALSVWAAVAPDILLCAGAVATSSHGVEPFNGAVHS